MARRSETMPSWHSMIVGIVFCQLLWLTVARYNESASSFSLRSTQGRSVPLPPGVLEDFQVLQDFQVLNCAIHKDASTTMRDFFNDVLAASTGTDPDPLGRDIECLKALGETTCRALVSEGDWLKMSVVREPEERLISAFLDKCARSDGPREACVFGLFPSVFGTDNPGIRFEHSTKQTLWRALEARRQELFEEFVRSLVVVVENPRTRCRINHHFAP
ncbi:unnamed protein product, partial [Phaeothamnion confervicola]